MSETIYANRGSARATLLGVPWGFRLGLFVVAVLAGGTLLIWITHTTWAQLDFLQKEYAAVSGESFYLGVSLRGSIRGLNEKLMQFGSFPDAGARSDFFKESEDIQAQLATNRVKLIQLAKLPLLKQVLVDDFDILDRIQGGLDTYLQHASELLNPTNQLSSQLSFQDRYLRVHSASERLLGLCNEMIKAQREDFGSFLAETQANLTNHQRLLGLTLILITVLAGTFAVSIYRGLIAPLREDLTASRRIIERQEKLASLGVLASGVAHEIRNPLTAIKFRLFSLKKAVPDVARNEDATIIADEINRLEGIVREFLRFARPSEPELVTADALRIVKDVYNLLNGQLERSGIALVLSTECSGWVHADPQQMKQVLINLIQNSAEAIGKNGTITLDLHDGAAELEGRQRPVLFFSVADTGSGIPPEIEPRLFDPFFTTKDGGTGLGLAIAARIVEKHGGILKYETQLNRGTTFEVVLPSVQHEKTESIAN